ncbi:LysR family transcriptional regulator [Aestuariirhabdus sp. Z084]|uniref:LysR family transcriptional regulator n=1 Tax=Aestuariirhabdus haliotis TaxID=2918751 RepID=UPI00201B3ACB|nr:LysR family transcriptional regulator [Aestuariirhabdus haliotis]MCL6414083.1 LysR family transcriptional regulator [Aestuariirhabdus haliotis]MCL6418015.1 LysR family transcriptional regulator [Aestuariirhabdus haliotis]
MINPVFLRTFMMLVETRHFTRTAEQLYMTQPGVSQHIKKLEAQLGKPLLDRHGKSFELTSAGESLYRYGLQQAEAERELSDRIAGDERYEGECKIACSGSMAMQFYPRLLDLQQRYPGLTVSLEAAPNSGIIDRVKNNRSDLGIVTQVISDTALSQQLLGEDELCLVLPRDARADWNSLMQLGFINHPDGHHYASQVLDMNFPHNFAGMNSVPQSGYINQISQILLPVSLAMGFTVVPQSLLDSFADAQRLSRAELQQPVHEKVYLIRKKHRRLPIRYQLVETLLQQQWL